MNQRKTPVLKRPPENWPELEALREIFLRAENALIAELGRLRSQGLADYHTEAALARVQKILQGMVDESWKYVPRMVERQFYVSHPEARKPLLVPETEEKHMAGYINAQALTIEQTAIVETLTMNLMGELMEAAGTAKRNMEDMVIGRLETDVFRKTGLSSVAEMQAMGAGAYPTAQKMIRELRRQGVTCFVDKAGRRWSLYNYCNMVARTTSHQAEVLAVLTRDPEQDLYKVTSHKSSCGLCAPYEGRVYSRSGTDPDFPPLASAFGKIDPAGGDGLANTYLNIHPNCLHQLVPWTPMGRSREELERIKRFSSFESNPPSRDPRSEEQIRAYRRREENRRKFLRDLRQFQDYKLVLGGKMPAKAETFLKHKLANDETYRRWQQEYLAFTQDHGILKRKLEDGSLKLNLNVGNQKKHIRTEKGYTAGRSYIYGTLEDAQKLVDQYSGTGKLKFTSKGTWTSKEFVVADKPVGVYVNPDNGEVFETRRFSIHYSKSGTHIVPRKEIG